MLLYIYINYLKDFYFYIFIKNIEKAINVS